MEGNLLCSFYISLSMLWTIRVSAVGYNTVVPCWGARSLMMALRSSKAVWGMWSGLKIGIALSCNLYVCAIQCARE